MGMREERLDWAAHMETHARRMHEDTGNPYYVVAAIAAARTAEWKVPDWALEILLSSVKAAYFASIFGDSGLSIDKALGITTKRGGTPPHKAAAKADIESRTFDLIRAIHHCFDVSIPEACEAVYSTIDYDFARSMAEILPAKGESLFVSDGQLERYELTREKWEEIQRPSAERTRQMIDSDEHTTDTVKSKLRQFQWWSVTRGDRLGYSIDTLIDRYYREGSKRPVRSGKAEVGLYLHFEGYFLTIIPDRFTTSVPDYSVDTLSSCVSALRHLTMRPPFAEFVTRMESVAVSK